MRNGSSNEQYKLKKKPIVTIGVFVLWYIIISCITCLFFLKIIGLLIFYVFGILFAKTYSFHLDGVKCSRPFLLGYGTYTIDYKDIESVWFFDDFFNKGSMEIFLKNGKKERLGFIFFLKDTQVEKVRSAIFKHTGKDIVSLNW